MQQLDSIKSHIEQPLDQVEINELSQNDVFKQEAKFFNNELLNSTKDIQKLLPANFQNMNNITQISN